MNSDTPQTGGILMLAGRDESVRWVYNALCAKHDIRRVIIENSPSTFKFLQRRAKRLGWIAVVGQLLFMVFVMKWLRLRCRSIIMQLKQDLGLSAKSIPENIVLEVDTINSDSVIEAIRVQQPDCILVNGTRIIAKRVLEASDAPFINMHAGITPLYRGVHGGYWALAEGEPEACGVTIHRVDTGIDTGGVLAQAIIQPGDEDCFVTYPLRQCAAGIELLDQILPAAQSGELQEIDPPTGESRLWYHPTLWQYLANRWKRGIK